MPPTTAAPTSAPVEHDHPRGEGRRVEAVVDRGDLVLLDGPAEVRVELLAGEHPEVVGAVAEVVAGLDRARGPCWSRCDRHDQRRHHGAHLQRVAAALGRGRCRAWACSPRRRRPSTWRSARPPSPSCSTRRWRAAASATDVGHDAQRLDLGGERLALGRATAGGRRTAGATRPRAAACRPARRRCTGGSGRSPRGRGRRRPTVSATITPSSPGGASIVRRVHDRLDLRDAHEVAQRHDADELAVVDHREVAVAVLGELVRTPPAPTTSGATQSTVCGHPLADLGVARPPRRWR